MNIKPQLQNQTSTKPTVLVTGGAGYIGGHACKALKNNGYTPVTFDNFSTGWREAIKFGPIVEGDLLDPSSLSSAFLKYQPDAVMHFAALSSVGESMTKPDLYWNNNVVGSLNLLRAMKEYGCPLIVFSSTAAVYGEPKIVPIVENAQKKPVNPYGASKLAIETILEHFAFAYNFRSVIFRYVNVAGADPEKEVGEHRVPETHLIPLILDTIAGSRKMITVFGTDYPTPDGTCIRDYIHVIDLISAHILALKHLLNGGESLHLNLGTKKGFSVREVINVVHEIIDKPFDVQFGKRRAGDSPKLICNNKKAQDLLGWTPQHSTLQEMIKDAWAWRKTRRFDR